MDNILQYDYVTITKKEYMELLGNSLNYKHLINAMLEKSEYSPYRGGLEFDQPMINHILCALETVRFYNTLNSKEKEYNKEMEKIKNANGNNQSDK